MDIYSLIVKLVIWFYKKRGLIVGKHLAVGSFGMVIDSAYPWLITIGDRVTLSSGCKLLTHDESNRTLSLSFGERIGTVNIGNNACIGNSAIVLPGVSIGENSIISAGSVVTKSVPCNVIAVGNPAKVICTIDEFKEKQRKHFDCSSQFNLKNIKTPLEKTKVRDLLNSRNSRGYFN